MCILTLLPEGETHRFDVLYHEPVLTSFEKDHMVTKIIQNNPLGIKNSLTKFHGNVASDH